MDSAPVTITRSFLPPREEFERQVSRIFTSGQLTNRGPLNVELTLRLKDWLGLDFICTVSNGTLALMLALRQAGLSGKKVITTPFSYVATVSALLWEGCTPIFADIEPGSLCLSPEALEVALRAHPDVAGVVPVHVYGNACDVEAIADLCGQYGLCCVYDAAHAFGSRYHGRSLLDYGDFAACSFHATKLFHTAEGGCIVSHSPDAEHTSELLHAFGHLGDEHLTPGINAKLSELHAAMGLAVLPHMKAIMDGRNNVCRLYESCLPQKGLARPVLREGLEYNHAYFPVLLPSEEYLLRVKNGLEAERIYPRRYFYPYLPELPYLAGESRRCSCPVAESAVRRVLCLPLHVSLEEHTVRRIATIITRELSA